MKYRDPFKSLPTSKSHGGSASRGRAKTSRPIATKRPMHLVFRSSRAKGPWSFARQRDRLEALLRSTAKRFGVKVYRSANVGNHFHLLVQAKRREDIQNFLRVFPQTVAFLVTGTRKGKAIGKFWDNLAFSRIVEWGREWETMLDYITKNVLEGAGMPRSEVDQFYRMKREVLRSENWRRAA